MDAAEPFILPQDLVFVDLETTGGNAAFHRVTEVGIVRVEAGRVVEEWSSLVNPECRIPAYIEAFTGITNAMVATAPRFAEIRGTQRAFRLFVSAHRIPPAEHEFLSKGALYRKAVEAVVPRASSAQPGCHHGSPSADVQRTPSRVGRCARAG
jgi:inhibitor of KinA sporulation pathway (predicted exonuclease)